MRAMFAGVLVSLAVMNPASAQPKGPGKAAKKKGATTEPAPAPSAPAPLDDIGEVALALERAKAAMGRFEYDAAIAELEVARARKGATLEQRVELNKLLGTIYASFDDGEKATAAFTAAFALDPTFVLPPKSSPKLKTLYDAARLRFLMTQQVVLQHQAPQFNEGEETRVDVLVPSGSVRITEMTLHYRLAGSGAAFAQAPLAPSDSKETFSAVIPRAFAGESRKATVEYFIRARDVAGALLASIGSETEPRAAEIVTIAPPSTPIHKSWVFWTVVGVVVAGAAVGIPLAASPNAPVTSGNLGTATLGR